MARWACLLRRADRRLRRNHYPHPPEKTTPLENCRCDGAECGARIRVRTHRLPDEWLLLWTRLQFAMGNNLSSPDSKRWTTLRRTAASHPNLRIASQSRPLCISCVAVSAQEVRRPGFRYLPGLL